MKSLNRLVSIFCLAALSASAVRADVVQLVNGDRVTGTLTSVDGTAVVIATEWGGAVLIARDHVRSVSTDEAMGVELDGGEEADFTLVETDSGEQGIRDASGQTREIGIGSLALVYRDTPPRSIADDFRLDMSYGLNITAGNADTQTHSVRGNLGFRRDRQRHTTRLEVDRKIDEGDVTKDQYRLGIRSTGSSGMTGMAMEPPNIFPTRSRRSTSDTRSAPVPAISSGRTVSVRFLRKAGQPSSSKKSVEMVSRRPHFAGR